MKKFKDIKNPEFIIKMAKEWHDLWAEVEVDDQDSFCDFVVEEWCKCWASLLDSLNLDKKQKEEILTIWCENIWKIIAEL